MTTKAYLRQIETIERKIERIEDNLRTIRAEMGGMKSPSYDTDHVQITASSDKMLDLIIKYEGLEQRLISERNKLIATRERIRSEIEQLDNDQYREVLYWIYISHLSWDDTADRMHYTRRWVEVLHGRALQEFERLHGNS